jgi:hypothetical protein
MLLGSEEVLAHCQLNLWRPRRLDGRTRILPLNRMGTPVGHWKTGPRTVFSSVRRVNGIHAYCSGENWRMADNV